MEADPGLVVPDEEKSLSEGAVAPWTNTSGAECFARLLEAVAAAAGFSTVVPWRQLPAAAKKVVPHGFREQVHLTCRNRFGRERSHLTRFEGVLPMSPAATHRRTPPGSGSRAVCARCPARPVAAHG